VGSGRLVLVPALLLLSIAAPSNAGPFGSSQPSLALEHLGELPAVTTGSFRLLSYNVAGLPEGISQSRPSTNIPLISPLLNHYDVVLVQEDFAFPGELRSRAEHPHRSSVRQSRSLLGFGDGLSRLSRQPFTAYARTRWRTCHGVLSHASDCLARKGFTVATHHLARGVEVDVYNLHMDAGNAPGDREARAQQARQLLRSIALRSAGRPVIVGGDTNLGRGDEEVVRRLLSEAGMTDACRARRCRDRHRIDRVLFRGSDALELTATEWRIDSRFVDGAGRPLSDHEAVAVEFGWVASRP
jgi:endonuclease/exonuclease/phosphatase family metal-dependent hydrolase